uniref:Trimethyllysine dioxygenase, mitochondrial n=1 Tax=Plectus sambesii TaxID=2011161 RepID=A0A914W4G0_9BILA
MTSLIRSAVRRFGPTSGLRFSARLYSESAKSVRRGDATSTSKYELVGVVVNNDANNSSATTNEDVSLSIDYKARNEPRRTTVSVKWLRDHCRSDTLYNWQTRQRKDDMTGLSGKAQLLPDAQASDPLAKHGVLLHPDSQTIQLNWKDGHKTVFDIDTLLDLYHLPADTDVSPLQQLWTGESLKKLPVVEAANSAEFAKNFVKYGIVAVEGVGHENGAATKALCETIAPFHTTFYEDFWVFSNQAQQSKDEQYHEDTAYSNEALAPHTDGTYFEQTPGIQVFHCLHPAASGGDTILVDGFNAVRQLHLSNPHAFDVLTRTLVPHHYLEGEVIDARCDVFPVIRLDSDGRLHQVRFNPYDRAPFKARKGTTVSDIADFYKSYEALARLMNDQSASLRVPLRPGTVLFIDNYRVLHGRTAFSGYRQLCGCYLSRDAFLSKARRHIPSVYRHDVS